VPTNRNKECLAEAGERSLGSRASQGGIRKANIPHAAAHFMRQDVSSNLKKMELTKLGYTEKWIEYGLLDDSILQMQIIEFEKGHDTNTEHYRYGLFIDWLRKKERFTNNEIDNYIELAIDDPNKLMAGSAVKELFKSSKLNSSQFEKIKSILPKFGEWTQKLIQGETLLRRLNNENLTNELFEECFAFGNKGILSLIIETSDNERFILELSENGSSKGLRNMAKVKLKKIRKAANNMQ